MRLSISNFSSCFIVKTLLFFAGMSILYYGLVGCVPKDIYGTTQWQTNVLKAQGYAFSPKHYSIVMTGSSELYNVHIERVSRNAFNLCFSGRGSATGLDIILGREKKPSVILVEMNRTIAESTDVSLIEKTAFWHWLPWNRENTRPDYLLHSIRLGLSAYLKQKVHYVRRIDEKTNTDILQMAQESYSKALEKQELHNLRMGGLNAKRKIDALKNEGVRIFLVESPHDESLYNSPRDRQIRDVLTEIFPYNQYDWITVDWKDYVTRDGFHLCELSAEKFAGLLLRRIDSMESTSRELVVRESRN